MICKKTLNDKKLSESLRREKSYTKLRLKSHEEKTGTESSFLKKTLCSAQAVLLCGGRAGV